MSRNRTKLRNPSSPCAFRWKMCFRHCALLPNIRIRKCDWPRCMKCGLLELTGNMGIRPLIWDFLQARCGIAIRGCGGRLQVISAVRYGKKGIFPPAIFGFARNHLMIRKCSPLLHQALDEALQVEPANNDMVWYAMDALFFHYWHTQNTFEICPIAF